LIYIRRPVRIGLVTLLFFIAFIGRRLLGQGAGPRLLRRYFQTCGGGFVKFGQLLAMRYDLLPPEYCHELSQLLDNLTPIPAAVIIAIIEENLGCSLDSCFEHFDSQPIGSASIAQVHRARLVSGEKVVVKVKRPGIERLFQVDFFTLKGLARFAQALGIPSNLNLYALVDELTRLSWSECNFSHEARNIQRMHDLMVNDGVNHYAPQVYFAYCRDAVVTMEQLEGIWMYELLDIVANSDKSQLTILSKHGVFPQQVAQTLLQSVLVQCYRHRLFHADPHAANIIVMRGGKIGYVDFGLVGWIDEHQLIRDFRLNQHIVNEEFHAAYISLLAMLEPLPVRNLERFEIEVKDLLRNWTWDMQNPYSTASEKSTSNFLLRLLNLIRRYNLRVPLSVLRLYRAFMATDIIILRLYPELNRFPALKDFIGEELRERQQQKLANTAGSLDTFASLIVESLGGVQTVLELAVWAQNNLPQLVLSYQPHPTPVQATLLLLAQYIRALALLVALMLSIGQFVSLPVLPIALWTAQLHSWGVEWWGAAIVLVLLALFLGQLLRQLIPLD
jgi:ubiquinone biosynthesis protein